MNFLRVGVTRTDGLARVALGDQALQAPSAIANSGDADVLMGIRAEYIQASARTCSRRWTRSAGCALQAAW